MRHTRRVVPPPMGDLAARPQQMQRPHDIAADLPRACSATIAMEVNHAANRRVKTYPPLQATDTEQALAAECGGTAWRSASADLQCRGHGPLYLGGAASRVIRQRQHPQGHGCPGSQHRTRPAYPANSRHHRLYPALIGPAVRRIRGPPELRPPDRPPGRCAPTSARLFPDGQHPRVSISARGPPQPQRPALDNNDQPAQIKKLRPQRGSAPHTRG